MTSAGGHPRTHDELADQLRAAQRGAAAPWFEEPRRQPPPLFVGALAATLTYFVLDDGASPGWLMFPALSAMSAFQAWAAWRSPASPAGRMPPELRRPLWILLAALTGVMGAIWVVARVLDPWPVVALAGALAWSIVTWHRRVQARALARLRDRLDAAPVATTPSKEDQHDSPLLDPLLDSPARIGLMSVVVASSRAVDVAFLGGHLALDRDAVTLLVAELEQMRYLDAHTGHGRRRRCAATYPGSVATRRHRQALRHMLAGAPA